MCCGVVECVGVSGGGGEPGGCGGWIAGMWKCVVWRSSVWGGWVVGGAWVSRLTESSGVRERS
jgi:hypothetical protein